MNNHIKVLHISYGDSKGAGLAALRIHKALLDIGIDSKMLVAHKSSELPTVFVAKESDLNRYVPPKNRMLRRIKKQLRNRGFCLTPLEQYQRSAACLYGKAYYTFPLSHYRLEKHPLVSWADVIHLHWIEDYVDYPTFFPNVNKPIVWTCHDENIGYGGFHCRNEKVEYYPIIKDTEDALLNIKAEALAQASRGITMVALSKMMKRFYDEVPMLRAFPHRVINNSVCGTAFAPIEKLVARKILRIPENSTVFGFASLGLWYEIKGLKTLMAALDQPLGVDSITLVCAGEGELPKASNFNFVGLGLINNDRFMSLFYSALDYFVLPSYQEAFSQVPLEAMACGVPVIAFPCSGTEDLINADNGVRCDEFTVESLAQGIREALGCHYDAEKIREDVLSRFGSQAIANQYVEVYNSAIG